MQSLQITRRMESDVDPKQLLRAHVDQMPVEKQREFVVAALQLLGDRIDLTKIARRTEREYLS